jgi:hypothetical protein
MAGQILTSSSHYFSAVEYYHAYLMKNWLALATLRSTKKIPRTNKLCTTSLRGKSSIFYANRLVTSMYWVVKWATLRKPKLIRIGPQGAPSRMKNPSLHHVFSLFEVGRYLWWHITFSARGTIKPASHRSHILEVARGHVSSLVRWHTFGHEAGHKSREKRLAQNVLRTEAHTGAVCELHWEKGVLLDMTFV